LRLRFNDVRLLYSDEWPIFSCSGWWVTVAAATFPGPAAANSWCRAQSFDPDHCFAKLIRTTGGPEDDGLLEVATRRSWAAIRSGHGLLSVTTVRRAHRAGAGVRRRQDRTRRSRDPSGHQETS